MFRKLMIRWELANPAARWAIEGVALLVAVGVLLYAVGSRG